MENQFQRTELLFGSDGLKKLSCAHVAIFGLGGVGGAATEALVRSGVGHVDLIDNDKISITNLNRQIFALHSTIGKYKTEAAKERLLDINPNVFIKTHNIFFSPSNSFEFNFDAVDYIIDAIDTVSSKTELILKAHEFNIPIISSMGTGNKTDPSMLEVSDIYKTSVCPLARVMRGQLRKKGVKSLKVVFSKETPIKSIGGGVIENNGRHVPSSSSFVPPAAGLIMASVVVRDLIS